MNGAARNILICTHDFARGGTERIAIGLARHWRLRGRTVAFLVGSRAGGLAETVPAEIAIHELAPPIPRSLTSRLRLGPAMALRIADLAPDVIFLPGNFQLPMVPALGKAKGRAALVAKISNPPLPPGLLAAPVRALFRRFAGALDGVAAMNSGLERELAAMVPGLPVRTLFDPVYLQPARAPAMPRRDGVRAIVWAGRFEPQKDVPLALATIRALARHGRFHLTMLGDGAELAATRRQLARTGLDEIVSLPGHVDAIDPYLAGADALLVTSRYEGGPAVAVEALAHGVPVVSTDCSHFLHDLMRAPAAGRIVASRDPEALARALAQVTSATPPDRPALRALTARFEPAICADAYLDWFDELAASRHSALPNRARIPIDGA